MKIDEVILGTDITSHYLDSNQNIYKLFRCGNPAEKNQKVYAVRYNRGEAVDCVHMWISHNKETKREQKEEPEQLRPLPKKLGKGSFGIVQGKTPHKAIKSIGGNTKMTKKILSHQRNEMLLEQKFRLHQEEIDQYFVIGLFRNKEGLGENLANIYIMPKVEEFKIELGEQDPEIKKHHIDTFALALKTLNNMGLAVPDYCGDSGDIEETGFQNDYYTVDGVRVFDLDSGFVEIENLKNKKEISVFKDQWLLVYNYKVNYENAEKWTAIIKEWYEANNYAALSEDPEELLRMHAAKLIQLPESIILELEVAKQFEGRASLSRAENVVVLNETKADATQEKVIKPLIQVKASATPSSFWWKSLLLYCCNHDSGLPDPAPLPQQSIKKEW